MAKNSTYNKKKINIVFTLEQVEGNAMDLSVKFFPPISKPAEFDTLPPAQQQLQHMAAAIAEKVFGGATPKPINNNEVKDVGTNN
ncbi:hypothetical protein EKK58_09155 [Candidatus Dependentiae bacterium]|nr:MAG: hypothetical protein EKK58_09155 [Candidatus Dependentiae bacterium]